MSRVTDRYSSAVEWSINLISLSKISASRTNAKNPGHEPHFEHVAGGSYRYVIWSGHGTDVERYGIMEFEMPFAAKPQTVHVTLKATGSGHHLLGSVWTRTKISLDMLTVEVRCANHAERLVYTDEQGHFDVRNLPPLPCELEVSNAYGNSTKVQLTSYANQRLELR